MIELKNINKEGLENLNLLIESGDIIAVKGDNATEKSRLLRIISLAEKADSGDILIDDKNIESLSSPAKLKLKNDSFSFIFPNVMLMPTLTAFDAILQPIAHRGITMENHKRGMLLLEAVGLKNNEHTLAKDLSVFEKKKLAIATSLIQKPLVVLADNPTQGLSVEETSEFYNLLLKLLKDESISLVASIDKTVPTEIFNKTQNI
jgi:D-methionine transport system ATP-binding protein